MLLYLAGPMRGIPEFNFPAFHAKAKELRDAGYEVWNPAERDEAGGFNPAGMTGLESMSQVGIDLRTVLAEDLSTLCLRAEGVALLSNWHRSSGAKAECATAEALGLPVRSCSAWLGRARG